MREEKSLTAVNALVRGASGYMVVRRDVVSTTAWTAAQKAEVYPAQCMRPNPATPAANALQTVTVGMAVTDSLTQHGHLEPRGARDWSLTDSGELFCQRLGVDLDGAKRAGTRHFARQCLDWSERRPHISGALGAAIADTFFKKGWAERMRRGRTVRLTDSGRRALGSHFGTSV